VQRLHPRLPQELFLLTPLLAQAESLYELADRTRRLSQSLTQPADKARLERHERELREQADLLMATARGDATPALLLADPLPPARQSL
jgi:hypothetical protein